MVNEKVGHHEEVLNEYPLTPTKSAGLHHDHVAAEALGGHTGDLPEGYFRSLGFIMTVVVCRTRAHPLHLLMKL